MVKRSRVAAIVNTLTDTDLRASSRMPRSACCMRCGKNRPTPIAIKRLTLLLLRDDPADDTPSTDRLRKLTSISLSRGAQR
jgi:hypothetical protein